MSDWEEPDPNEPHASPPPFDDDEMLERRAEDAGCHHCDECDDDCPCEGECSGFCSCDCEDWT